jgi:tetratricopeptide (TPR) repeat protein
MISLSRLIRYSVRVAAWATPHVKEWHRQRNLNLVEGQRHLEARNWPEAEKHLVLALSERKHSDKRRVELLLDLQKSQHRQNKLAEADQTARAAIELAARRREASLHSRALDSLTDVQLTQGQYGEALRTAEEIARLEGAQPKPDYARLAKCSRKLGTALLKNQRLGEAKAAFERAAGLAEQAFGTEHIETADSFAELGALCRQMGDHGEAQRFLRRALQIRRAAAGADSHEATQDLFHLAASLEESGDVSGAVGEYERALSLTERQVGGNRDEKAAMQARLAGLYLETGRIAPARELLTMAIGILERKGGERLALALETMARVEETAGRPGEAERWRQKALATT